MSKPSINRLSFALLLLFAISCKKDSNGDFSFDKYYATPPDIQNCVAGSLNNSSKQAALARLNYIRSLHKLPPVEYHAADDELAQQSALISAANAMLDHSPAINSECYSATGALGCSKSNLGISLSSQTSDFKDETNVDRWLTEEYSETIGHRRWMLDPFLKYIAYGRVDGKPKKSNYKFVSAASMKILNNEVADIPYLNIPYVAYPFEDYPATLFLKNGFLSFSALYDKYNEGNNGFVKYDSATVEVTGDNGMQMPVSSISFDNEYEGLPNSIQWKVDGLKDNTTYTVKIQNVHTDGNAANYRYTFRLVK
jgi:uncharacterized protein YkwD